MGQNGVYYHIDGCRSGYAYVSRACSGDGLDYMGVGVVDDGFAFAFSLSISVMPTFISSPWASTIVPWAI
ncbi:MAG: hypothetical protein ACOX3R_02250 [Desulfitobacteriia bacterium]